jgi:hypothetical protein
MDTKQGWRPWLFTLVAAGGGCCGSIGWEKGSGAPGLCANGVDVEQGRRGLGEGVHRRRGGAPSTGYGAAAGSSRRRRAHEGREVQGLGGSGKRGKRSRQGLASSLIEEMEREGAPAG